jgi:glutathione S-transferase
MTPAVSSYFDATHVGLTEYQLIIPEDFMPYVALVTVLALAEFIWFGILVSKARTRYGVPAPASTGNEMFERAFRVQMNTLEQLVVFLPVLWIFAHYVSPYWAAGLGAVFIIGRAIYARSYVRDPSSRSLGFALTALPSIFMLVGILWAAVRTLLSTAG